MGILWRTEDTAGREDGYNIRWQLMISGMVTEYSQTMTARLKIKLHHRHGTVNLLSNIILLYKAPG